MSHVLAQSSTPADQNSAILKEVDAAWSNRKKSIQSIEVEAEIDRIIKGRGVRGGARARKEIDPLRSAEPVNDLLSKATLTYAISGLKVGSTYQSARVVDLNNPDATTSLFSQFVFDGKANSQLTDYGGIQIVTIKESEKADGHAYANAAAAPIGLLLDPKRVLVEAGWQVDDMAVDALDVKTDDGARYATLKIVRKSPDWTSHMDVDPKYAFAPVRWETWYKGKPASSYMIQYEQDGKTQPLVRGWTYTRHDETGNLEVVCQGRVSVIKINEPVDDRRFTMTFRKGARIVKEDAKGRPSYFHQTDKGLLPVEKDKFSPPLVRKPLL